MEIFNKLVDWFVKNGGDNNKAIVALSGGVDSAVVALAAKKGLGDGAIAITADYNTLAQEELATALRVAREIGIKHRVIEYNELENHSFVKNDAMRCYYCMIELGIGKIEIRNIAKSFDLSVYDKPSNACLASRIPTGSEVTYDRLQRIENAEIIVKTIFGVRQVRVRDHGDLARIEVGRDELHMMFDMDKLATLDKKLKALTFKFVSIDITGYKTGKLVVIDRYD